MSEFGDATRDHYKHRLERLRRPLYSSVELAPWLSLGAFLLAVWIIHRVW